MLKNNSIINYCNKCKGNLCDKCKNTHNNKYPKHIPLNAKINYIEPPEKEKMNELLKCMNCQEELLNKINEPI